MSRHTFAFFFPWICSHSANPTLWPSFHPHSFVSDIRSVLGGCSRFSRCCYLIIVLSSHVSVGVGRQDLVAVTWTRRVGCTDRNSLGHCPHRFLAIAQWFVHFSAHPQPMEQYRQLSSHGHHRSFHTSGFWAVP